MKFREHRGSLVESMATVVEIEPTRDAILLLFVDAMNGISDKFRGIGKEKVHVDFYAKDDRIGWNSHIVTIDGFGVFGFTDGPVR